MDKMDVTTWLQIMQIGATFLLVPAFRAFRGLEKAINELRLELHRDFVKKPQRK